jgi:hypothetical protein
MAHQERIASGGSFLYSDKLHHLLARPSYSHSGSTTIIGNFHHLRSVPIASPPIQPHESHPRRRPEDTLLIHCGLFADGHPRCARIKRLKTAPPSHIPPLLTSLFHPIEHHPPPALRTCPTPRRKSSSSPPPGPKARPCASSSSGRATTSSASRGTLRAKARRVCAVRCYRQALDR